MKKIDNAELLNTIRQLRRMVATLDSIGYATDQLLEDEELELVVPKGIVNRITQTTTDIHNMIQKIEANKRYKDATRMLCVDRP